MSRNKGATLWAQSDGNITGGSFSFPSRAGLLPTNTPLQASLGWWDSHHAVQFVSKAEELTVSPDISAPFSNRGKLEQTREVPVLDKLLGSSQQLRLLNQNWP